MCIRDRIFPHFAENFGVNVRAFPEFLPTELTVPPEMNPSEYTVLLGSMIRYSD